MLIVEVPLSSLEREEAVLEKVDRANTRMYALGALDAIRWIIKGGMPPSERWMGKEEYGDLLKKG